MLQHMVGGVKSAYHALHPLSSNPYSSDPTLFCSQGIHGRGHKKAGPRRRLAPAVPLVSEARSDTSEVGVRIVKNESVLGFGALFFTVQLFAAQLEALLKGIRHLALARSALSTQIEVLKLL